MKKTITLIVVALIILGMINVLEYKKETTAVIAGETRTGVTGAKTSTVASETTTYGFYLKEPLWWFD